MPHVDLLFPVLGETLPTDHAYPLYGALSRLVPTFHQPDGPRFAAINGHRGPRGQIQLYDGSRLRVRLPAERIAAALPLAGKPLSVGDHRIRLGVPQVVALVPAPVVQARIVTFKHAVEPEPFLEKARIDLRTLGLLAIAEIPKIERVIAITDQPNRQGAPRRMVLRIKERRIIGYALRISGLTAEESILLQEQGLGGRRRIGAGYFMPVREGR